ncbi:sensor histidine kinase [Azospirillum rugosum]|uniref:histidine kinase n=1 Tax=Azospirillum rugosum TaxID=416170 RepID=A0ABS4SU08_9PROT|nr:ATP-binding protein [Azospirillum rugosum]MBP2295714.1 two-component system cell cycle sensor histidine kinase PleC [Azospirillum rugosum]MDQ0526777.1 two-component system cell cycle sensor histidine kinase PleC [Azospirillum rugosum]
MFLDDASVHIQGDAPAESPTPARCGAPEGGGEAQTAAALAVRAAAIGPGASRADAVRRLDADPGLPALAVVAADGRVLGLVERDALARLPADSKVRDVLTAPCPTVEAALPLAEAARRLARAGAGSGFVVVEDGRYLGVGSAAALAGALADLADRRERQLEEARRAKTVFFACMSHEIRTPLNAMMGFAELLEQEVLGPHATPLYRDYARDIGESGRHLLDLINDLLDLAKADADKLDLIEETVEVPGVALGSARLLSVRAGRAGVRIETVLPAGLPTLRVDERKLRQMLLNLLWNAVKFTPNGGPGGGLVTLGGGVAGDGTLRLWVRDSGIGMTAAELARALEPWGQIDSALGRQHVGSGLGLPLTKRLVELHGGRLDIETAPGRGTTMTLVFPAERVGR